MLSTVADDVKKNYYDPKLHGLDWDALVKQARQEIDKAPNMAAANAEIAALLEHLDDSSTFFEPPRSSFGIRYGWNYKIYGKHCFVTEVDAGSDAEMKGMRTGDEVLTIDGLTVERASVAKLHYAMNVLMPRSSLNVVLRKPTGGIINLATTTKVEQHRRQIGTDPSGWNKWEIQKEAELFWDDERAEIKELGPEVMVLRVHAFFQSDEGVDPLFKKARKHKTLIIDLRNIGRRREFTTRLLGKPLRSGYHHRKVG